MPVARSGSNRGSAPVNCDCGHLLRLLGSADVAAKLPAPAVSVLCTEGNDTLAYHNLLIETADAVATLTVNRPDKLNALNRETIEELHACVNALRGDAAVRVVVITGALANKSAGTLRLALKAVNEGANMTLDATCRLEAALFGVGGGSADAREGCAAFLEKRKPKFGNS